MSRAIFLLVFVLVAGCGEVHEVYYPTAEAAISEGAMARGWVPGWLPKSAVEIHEIHDIDTNQSMLAFRFHGAEKIELFGCEQIEPDTPQQPPFSATWWPPDVPARSLSTYHRHMFYSCEEGEAFMAVSEKVGEAFYWRP